MVAYLNIAQILVSILLMVVILLQSKGAGGGVFGTSSSVFRTRRGVEKTLFQFTIILGVVFLLVSMLSVRLGA